MTLQQWTRRLCILAAAGIILGIATARARAGFVVNSFGAGPNGGARVDGFPVDIKTAYTSILDQVVTRSVAGRSGDADNSATYAADETYYVPSAGSTLTVSGSWSFDTSLSTLMAPSIGAGLSFDAYLDMTAGQTFTIAGTMTNAGITLLDPDNQAVFPFFNNYFSGSQSTVSLSGTLAKSGIYRLNMTSSIFTSGTPSFNAHQHGGENLVFSLNAPTSTPEPSTFVLVALGIVGTACRRGLRCWRGTIS